jgi:hypothetical protein
MNFDVSALTFRDATAEEKKRIFLILNTRGFLWSIVAIVGIVTAFLLRGKMQILPTIALAIAAVVLIVAIISDMPAWTCKVCTGTVSNKREVSASTETGLYYDAVTFTSDKGEVLEAFPIYSDKALKQLGEGTPAVIICYNKRQPILLPLKQIQPK